MDDSLKELVGQARLELNQARSALASHETTLREVGMHDCYLASRRCALTVLAVHEGRQPRYGESLIARILDKLPQGPKELHWLDQFHTFRWEGPEAGNRALDLTENAINWAERTLDQTNKNTHQE